MIYDCELDFICNIQELRKYYYVYRDFQFEKELIGV